MTALLTGAALFDPEDILAVLSHYREQLGCTYNPTDPADAEIARATATVTGGNARLFERLMTQIACVMTINQRQTIVPGVVQAARQNRVGEWCEPYPAGIDPDELLVDGPVVVLRAAALVGETGFGA